MRSRTSPYDLTSIRAYPDTLQIYRIDASKYWQVRLFLGRKYLRKSTRCECNADAIEFAKSFFDEVKIAQRLDFDIHRDTFAACANHLMIRQEAMVGRDERDSRLLVEDRKKLDKDILPFFGTKANRCGASDGYGFFPQYRNREYALQTIRRQFEYVLEHAGLKEDARGRARTLCSLRDTALMFRLLKGDNVDIFLLARNALTSVDELERFYLSHAESRMRIENLQSFGS